MRRTASIASIVIGVLLILGAAGTWILVSGELSSENITVSDDASCLAGDEVNGPFSVCTARRKSSNSTPWTPQAV